MKYQFNGQIFSLCLHFIGEGKLGIALFILEINTRNNVAAHKEVLQFKCRHRTLMDKVIELSSEDKITQLNRISYGVLDFIFEYYKGDSDNSRVN